MTINVSLEMRIRRAIDLILSAHRLPSIIDETMNNFDEKKVRLQDYAFTQGFCLMIESFDKKRQRLILKYSRQEHIKSFRYQYTSYLITINSYDQDTDEFNDEA
jgi:hypothetical protein